MTIVLTNDDGIDAPGIEALRQVVNQINSNNQKVVTVAPRDHYSGCGHQVTTHIPIHLQSRSPLEFAVAGTPADCVRVALRHLHPEVKLVISGINYGGNMGVDAYISGTVAAVREAAFHGIPAIAISQYLAKGKQINWEITAKWATKSLLKLLQLPAEPNTFWNVNLPHLNSDEPEPEIVFCLPCIRPLPVEFVLDGEHLTYTGKYEMRERVPGTDVDACFSGNIAVTKIKL